MESDFAGIGNKYGTLALRKFVLQPALLYEMASFRLDHRKDAVVNAARAKHQTLLEELHRTERHERCGLLADA